jgi:hypothetical protein
VYCGRVALGKITEHLSVLLRYWVRIL